ncbi:MAG: protein translocase subunit SecF [Deltaproteobacteria bacterium]|nr:protein translocase subunit SecF [Deltaproteobacteria bacterium]
MEFIKPGRVFDFMRYRNVAVVFSTIVVALSIGSVFFPGPRLGIDFAGGTEVQLQFQGDVPVAELRSTLEELGYESPDVIAITGHDNQYLVRVNEVTTLPPDIAATIEERLDAALEAEVTSVRVSGGGDKVSIRLEAPAELDAIRAALVEAGVDVRGDVRAFGPASDHRFEADLVGVADRMVAQLEERLGERGPEPALRIEWVGPRAGAQLRNGAIKALIYAMGFIMMYVAFRFDLRFAPGGILALIHDAAVTVGVFVLVGKEFNLTTVASLLTIIGYSINDTIVIYDRIRENMARHRDKSLSEIINISTSEMLSRTIITSGVTLLAIVPFFFWGTQVIADIAFALFVGFIAGVYSTIYIAAPVTEFMDARIFAPARAARQAELEKQRALRAKAKGGSASAAPR